jgi:GTP-binding protein EngB required for normal cell division
MDEMLTRIDQATRLRDYVLAKQEVTATVRAAEQQLRARGDAERAEEFHALVVKLAEDRFNLAVVGQFKRGKSSLMNAVIGRELLPTGLLPLTSAITTLCYGPEERVSLKRQGWALTQEIALDELADYVTERGNPGNEKGVIEARVELPVAFLRRGLYFIDTPGVGSARQENTATTYAFLPEADAVIFVTSVESPLSETEQNFLRDIRVYVRKLFVVVNKMDLLAPEEHEEVLDYIRSGLQQTLGTDNLRLYALSAREGLAAKRGTNGASLEQSGLAEFEWSLASFLATGQGRTFLVSILDRAQRLLADEAETELRPKIESLREMLLTGAELAGQRTVAEPLAEEQEILERAVQASRADNKQPDARALLRGGTCPICDAQTQRIFSYFAQWQYTLATEERAQRAFAAARGFCHFHTWQFGQIASPLGISEGYAPLIEAVTAELRQTLETARDASAADGERWLSSVETCPACRVLRETEVEQRQNLVAQLETAEGRDTYERSRGLCLPHLGMVLKAALPDGVGEFLLKEQVQRLEELSEDMRSYTLKRAALRRALLNANEEHAWRRALVQLTGERNVRRV